VSVPRIATMGKRKMLKRMSHPDVFCTLAFFLAHRCMSKPIKDVVIVLEAHINDFDMKHEMIYIPDQGLFVAQKSKNQPVLSPHLERNIFHHFTNSN